MDGWMDLGQNARGSSFFFQMALLFSFSFFFSFGFPRKLKGKEKGIGFFACKHSLACVDIGELKSFKEGSS
jgi:hypothetical protein